MITVNLFQTSIRSSDQISYIIEDRRTCSLFPWDLDPCFSKYYIPASCTGISWELVRKAESLASSPHYSLPSALNQNLHLSTIPRAQTWLQYLSLDRANHHAHLDLICLAFYRFAFTESQLPLHCSFHGSPPQETLMESSTVSSNSVLSRVVSVKPHWLLKLKSHGRKFF